MGALLVVVALLLFAGAYLLLRDSGKPWPHNTPCTYCQHALSQHDRAGCNAKIDAHLPMDPFHPRPLTPCGCSERSDGTRFL